MIILDGKEERQGDYILTANHLGEYAFCFENDMSTITEKLVDFDIMVCGWPYLISVEDGQLTLVDRWRVNQERRHQGSPHSCRNIPAPWRRASSSSTVCSAVSSARRNSKLLTNSPSSLMPTTLQLSHPREPRLFDRQVYA